MNAQPSAAVPDRKPETAATQLKRAVKSGDHATVHNVLGSAKLSAVISEQTQQNLLFTAAGKGYSEVVHELLRAGANANCETAENVTPLLAASSAGNSAIVRLLLEFKADPNIRAKNGAGPIFAAAGSGHAEVTQLLVDGGASVTMRCNSGMSPLYAAVAMRQSKTAEILLNAGATITDVYNQRTLLVESASQGDMEMAKMLLAHGANIAATTPAGTAVQVAMNNKHKAFSAFMIKKGAANPIPAKTAQVQLARPPKKGENSPVTPDSPDMTEVDPQILERLAHACQTGDLEVVQSLAPTHANALCGNGKYPVLFLAACSGSASVVGALLHCGADVNVRAQSNATPLFAAATRGHADVAKILLVAQADPNLRASNGASPLFAAAGKGHLPIVEMLLAAGAVADLSTTAGATALIIAIQKQDVPVVKMLLQHANPDKTQKDVTPLLFATKLGNEGILRALLQAGAAPNACGPGGISPVFCAAVDGSDRVLEILLETEAGRSTVDQPTTQGETPLRIAEKNGHAGCYQKLLAARAQNQAQESNTVADAAADPHVVSTLAASGGGVPTTVPSLHQLLPMAQQKPAAPSHSVGPTAVLAELGAPAGSGKPPIRGAIKRPAEGDSGSSADGPVAKKPAT